VAAFAAVSAAGVVLAAHVASSPPILSRRWALLAELGAWAAVWAVGVYLALRLPRRWAAPLILAAGVALRVAALAGPPVTSDDLFRYAWDGRVQERGIDPYAHAPGSPSLAKLREPWLWPGAAGCEALRREAGCTLINRPGAPTIYPPAAEAWFNAVSRSAGGVDHRHKPWQVAGLATEVGVLALLPVALRRFGRDGRWTALYALSPAPVLEIVNNGHVDGLAALFVVGALAVAGGQGRRRDVAAGALLGLAALVKLFPAVLVVAFVTLAGGRALRSVARAGAAAAAVVALGYLPHVAAVGWRVLGYAPGYLEEENYVSGGRFLLAGAAGLDGAWAAVASAAALAAVGAWLLRRRPPVPAGAALLVGALLLASSPVQPWYAVLLLAVATVAAQPRWAAVVAAGYPYFFAVILDHGAAAAIGRLGYIAALVVVVAAARLRQWSERDDAVGAGDEGGDGVAHAEVGGIPRQRDAGRVTASQRPVHGEVER